MCKLRSCTSTSVQYIWLYVQLTHVTIHYRIMLSPSIVKWLKPEEIGRVVLQKRSGEWSYRRDRVSGPTEEIGSVVLLKRSSEWSYIRDRASGPTGKWAKLVYESGYYAAGGLRGHVAVYNRRRGGLCGGCAAWCSAILRLGSIMSAILRLHSIMSAILRLRSIMSAILRLRSIMSAILRLRSIMSAILRLRSMMKPRTCRARVSKLMLNAAFLVNEGVL